MAGIVTSPQLRESPETAKFQAVEDGAADAAGAGRAGGADWARANCGCAAKIRKVKTPRECATRWFICFPPRPRDRFLQRRESEQKDNASLAGGKTARRIEVDFTWGRFWRFRKGATANMIESTATMTNA